MISIIPAPVRLEEQTAGFNITTATTILASHDEARPAAEYLAARLRTATGYDLPLVDSLGSSAGISLVLDEAGSESGAEAYRLEARPEGITITAAGGAGLFYGVQTLLQLLPPEVFAGATVEGQAWEVPGVVVEDGPRFRWRGSMLDVSRHFFDKEFVKRYIDLLAMHKLNTFHWHLTDDQGWRIEIKKFPRLSEVSAWRTETMGDGTRYGGFFTQDDVREVVQYATDRYITVVPEIEMPGHSRSALAAYSELSCTGGPIEVWTQWGISEEVYCAGNDATFEFLQDVLDEVLELFPSEFVHIGGDECPKARWRQCPKCQARIQAEGLADVHQLQSYFIRRMEGYLASKGRRLVGWSEIREGGLAPGAVMMDWIGGGAEAAQMGHDAVMSPTSHCYFDYYQSEDRASEPHAQGGFISLEKVYSFEPVPAGLSPEQQGHILGGQANVWTEYMATEEHVEYMAYPRLTALAEVVWSPAAQRDLADFHRRLQAHLHRLDAMHVHYRPLDGASA